MTKANLVATIIKEQKKGKIQAPKEWLMKKSISDLQRILTNSTAINSVSQKEISKHCNVSFIR